MTPHDQIVPIVGFLSNGSVRFLGTAGTFVVPGPLLLTANHVIRDWKGGLAISHLDRLDDLLRAEVVKRDQDSDLAALRVSDYVPPSPIGLAEDQEIHPNLPVVCFEYGTTQTAGGVITLAPATRLGNVTRLINLTDRHGRAGDDALELSFPALRGASGAPVLANNGFRLWGVVIANVSYHLLPAQIDSVLDDKGTLTEETRFMLPQAVAVHVKHARQLIGSI
jgi:V8-like Glu-specific endopeptidase